MSDLTLEHYSETPFFDWINDAPQRGVDNKPRGLWLSVPGPDDWPSWCRAEEFRLERLTHVSQFKLAEGHNVLILDSPDAILAFDEKYRCLWLPPATWAIDWSRVAEDHDGLVIAPYQWELRFNSRVSWYYGWDCASGCVWKASALVRTRWLAGAEQ